MSSSQLANITYWEIRMQRDPTSCSTARNMTRRPRPTNWCRTTGTNFSNITGRDRSIQRSHHNPAPHGGYKWKEISMLTRCANLCETVSPVTGDITGMRIAASASRTRNPGTRSPLAGDRTDMGRCLWPKLSSWGSRVTQCIGTRVPKSVPRLSHIVDRRLHLTGNVDPERGK
jgi:hypothetical protein